MARNALPKAVSIDASMTFSSVIPIEFPFGGGGSL
jgi:hypothetical protein